jgi:alpha-amylase/alpha-mannosidase (GH57 family)
MDRFICVHGHFYQPPRENAWLEFVERQDSAYPYHDWNERVSEESYAPNAASRILENGCNVRKIVNNYSTMSFDFGPTLLSWLEEKDPETYQAIIRADQESAASFSGHGSATAHPYNHMIMPMANRRDKVTQVLWGIGDFEHRFGRRPEGMWLPETAVDLETLEIMAEAGITFSILSQHQAKSVRRIGNATWTDTMTSIDPTMPYRIVLPSGRLFSLFFYDAAIAQGVAFSNLLENGEALARRLLAGFSKSAGSQLVSVATDGETYGHHRRFGDMALAYAVDHIGEHRLATMTNYAEYLAKHPPTYEVQIIENTSWSCIHGVERWRADCGCNAGRNRTWNQAWRAPLRADVASLLYPMVPSECRKPAENTYQAIFTVDFRCSPTSD